MHSILFHHIFLEESVNNVDRFNVELGREELDMQGNGMERLTLLTTAVLRQGRQRKSGNGNVFFVYSYSHAPPHPTT